MIDLDVLSSKGKKLFWLEKVYLNKNQNIGEKALECRDPNQGVTKLQGSLGALQE